MLPLGGLLIAIFAGWIMSRESTMDELGLPQGPVFQTWRFLVRFVCPIAVAAILLANII
jgi:NSS family neurotransmitter:Na+ symporter